MRQRGRRYGRAGGPAAGHTRMIACAVALSAFVGIACATSAPAQPFTREDRLRRVEWYLIWFVLPRDACTVAGGEALTRFEEGLAVVRERYVKEFALIEGTKEYFATLLAARLVDKDRFKGPNGPRRALQDCTEGVSRMATVLQQRHYFDEAFKSIVTILSSPN